MEGVNLPEPEPNPQVIYRCKKCRRIVASQDNVVPHERGGGEKCFKWRKRSSDNWNTENEPQCSSIFVEPMKWMEPGEPAPLESGIQTIHISYTGMQCSCGAWVNPAFQLHKSKLDECKT